MRQNTRGQKFAQEAYRLVANKPIDDSYKTFSKKFPALIHTCGLAQAVSFASAKSEYRNYLNDLALVLAKADYPFPSRSELENAARTNPVGAYLRLSRDAIEAASWLKRYVEAVKPDGAGEDHE
jgi:CRISPR-associated protein Cmr5